MAKAKSAKVNQAIKKFGADRVKAAIGKAVGKTGAADVSRKLGVTPAPTFNAPTPTNTPTPTRIDNTNTPSPINTPNITPAGEPGFKEVTEKTNATNDVVGPDAPGTRNVDSTVGNTPIDSSIEGDIVDKNNQLEADLKTNNEQALKDAAAQKKADEDRAKKHADEIKANIKGGSDKISKIEDDRRDRLEQEQADENERLRQKEDQLEANSILDKEKVAAQAEMERIKNEQLIADTKAGVEMERQQSAWAYQKLGLGFSSGIINQSQQIATNGLVKILGIEATMSLNRQLTSVSMRKLDNEIQGFKLEYAGLISKNNSFYSDKIDDLDTNAEKRINENTKNLLLNTQQKEDKIAAILNNYRKEKTALERQHIDDTIKIQDRGFAYQQKIEAQIEIQRNIGKTNINDRLKDGSLFTMSGVELDKLAVSAGITMTQIDALKKTSIAGAVSGVSSNMMGEDYVIGETDRNSINVKVNSLMQGGKTLQEATEIATKEVLKNTPEYKKLQSAKNAELDKTIASAIKGSGTSSTGYTPKASDFDKNVLSDGRIQYTNKITQETFYATEKGEVRGIVGRNNDGTYLYGPTIQETYSIAKSTPIKGKEGYYTGYGETLKDEGGSQIEGVEGDDSFIKTYLQGGEGGKSAEDFKIVDGKIVPKEDK